MNKARLIKKQEMIESEGLTKQAPVSPVSKDAARKAVKKTVDAMVDWIDNQRKQRQDPRKAFDALFSQS